jgi:hypothetical protein
MSKTAEEIKLEEEAAALKASEEAASKEEPMWKQMGYESLDDMLIQNEVVKAEAETRSDLLVEELKKPGKPVPVAPVFDATRYENEGDTYLVQHQSQVEAYAKAAVEQVSAPTPTTEIDKQATIKGVMKAAELQKLNPHTTYALMDSMAKTAEHAHLAQTTEGIKVLGRMAIAELKKAIPVKPGPAPEKTITPSKSVSQGPTVDSDVKGEALRQKAIEEAQKKGNSRQVTQLRSLKGLPEDVINETIAKLLPSLSS